MSTDFYNMADNRKDLTCLGGPVPIEPVSLTSSLCLQVYFGTKVATHLHPHQLPSNDLVARASLPTDPVPKY